MKRTMPLVIVAVGLTGVGVSALRAEEALTGRRYHVNVIEWRKSFASGQVINDRGQIASNGPHPDDPSLSRSRLYDPEGGFTVIDRPAFMSRGLNNAGEVTGTATDAASNLHAAYRWDARNGLVLLPDADFERSDGIAINNGGDIVGHATLTGGQPRAIFWGRDGHLNVLDEPEGSRGSYAYDISNSGMIAGAASIGEGLALRWNQTGEMEMLPTMAEAVGSWGSAINERGWVVGGIEFPGDGSDWNGDGNPDLIKRAALWDDAGNVRNLGSLRPDSHSGAMDIHDDGTVIGYSRPLNGATLGQHKPFIWSEQEGMVAIEDLLDEESKDWRLSAFGNVAGRINARGDITVFGTLDDQMALVVLTQVGNPHPRFVLPEPGFVLSACVGCGWLLLRRRVA